MLKSLRNKNAQAISGEYVLLIFLIVGMMTAMSIYIRRSLQARIHDARDTMVDIVKTRAGGAVDANLYVEYEPYYTNTASIGERNNVTQEELFAGGGSKVTYDETASQNGISITAPPKDAGLW